MCERMVNYRHVILNASMVLNRPITSEIIEVVESQIIDTNGINFYSQNLSLVPVSITWWQFISICFNSPTTSFLISTVDLS
jgi:hypothetical protein